MNWNSVSDPAGDISSRLKWLMLARVVFTTFLLGSTIVVQFQAKHAPIQPIVTVLYVLIGIIFFLSLLYALLANRIKRQPLFGYLQIGVDSFIVTLIVFVTGGFFSFFSFLYLVVIIYANMILFFRGGLVLALLSTLQYALMIALQYAEVLPPVGYGMELAFHDYSVVSIGYKVLITAVACFGVAVLSGLLTEQNRRTQKELKAMESHVRRVEKMAYMGEMAAGLAHEIKNPLASLSGSIQMLKADLRYDADHERLMDIILRETERLGTLVNDFLFFARPPAGKPEKINLKEAIDEIAELFRRDTLIAKTIDMKKDLSPEIWVVMDPTHLRQVLWNLLLNAAQAIDEGGQIQIKTDAIKQKQVTIHVIDNGCGMPDEVVPSIFDPFYTTKPEGTGLGLSIVHRILEAYSSRLDVQTAINSGTCFSFTLQQASPSMQRGY
jgi:two-component system, NtrC family, sensor histidine kinase HydH